MDYNSLVLQIQNYANRTDAFFVNSIPDFINQGISRIYSEAKNIGFQKIQAGNTSFVVGQNFVNKPADWRETISFQYTIPGPSPFATFILPRTYEFCKSYAPNVLATGAPVFYADFSYTQFFIVPTPNIAYPYLLTYLGLPLFNLANPQNFLTQRYPSLLLYACLFETIPYLKDDERVATFESLYLRALKDIDRDTTERYTDRTSKRDKD